MPIRLALKCGMTGLAAAMSAQLHAQQQPPALDEIIVTAQKRAESAQDIPLSIDVITGDAFIREGVRDVKDIQKMSTDLEINTNQGATIIGMRGMQPTGFALTGDTLTAVHLDGAFLSSFWGLNGLMYDLERIEVLAGPQGTLYGRNTAAGAVNMITKRPGREFEANGSIEYGSENTTRFGGGITVPVSDTFAARLAGQKYTRDALFSDGGSEQDQWGTRLSLQWTPSERGSVFATADYSSFKPTSDPTTLYAVDQNVRAVVSVSPAGVPTYSATQQPTSVSAYSPPGDLYDNQPYETQRGQVFFGHNEQTNWGVMAQYTHEFGAFSTTLQYSHRELEGVTRSTTKTPTQFSGSLTPNVVDSDVAELRFTSTAEGQFEWVGGLFWTQAEARYWGSSPVGDPPGDDPITGLDIPTCPCSSGFFPNSGDMYSYAAYGQTTWTPESQPRLHLTGGLRYTFDWKDATLGYFFGGTATTAGTAVFAFGVRDMPESVRALFANIPDAAVNSAGVYDNNRTWDGFQYKLGLQYDLSDSSLVYGSVSTGYKSGGLIAGPTPEVKPEELLAYEIGAKSRFLGNTLQLNTSVWYYDYSDLEITLSRPLGYSVQLPNNTTSSTAPSRASVGKVELAGVSMDADWLFTASDQVGLSFTHIYSRVLDGTEITAAGQRNEILNKGERIGDAPKWQILGRYSHTFTLASGARLNPQLKYQWQSKKYDGSLIPGNAVPVGGNVNLGAGRINLERQNPGQTTVPAQGILDVSLRFTPPSERWDVTAYVNNVADELDIKSLSYDNNPGSYNALTNTFTANGTYGQTTATLGEPRTWGVILTARF